MDRRLVDHFVNADLVSRASMQRFILRATRNKTGVLQEILESETLDEQAVANGLSSCYGHELLGDEAFDVDPGAIAMISGKMAKENGVLPVAVTDSGNKVTVAVYDTEGAADVLDTLRTATGNQPRILVATRTLLQDAIDHYYFDEEWALKNDHTGSSAGADSSEEVADGDSVEILLDEIAEVENEASPPLQASPKHKISPPSPRARSVAGKPPAPPARKKPRKRQDSVEKALEDFDSFLDESNYASGAPGIGSGDDVANDSQWGSDDHMKAQSGFSGSGAFGIEEPDREFDDEAFASAFHDGPDNGQIESGFDLFEPSEADSSIESIAVRNEERIQKLRQELKGQREVVSALVDLLVEARVLSRKELMQIVRKKRR